MKLLELTPAQAAAVVQAAWAVVSAGGGATPAAIEVECIEALQRHMLRRDPALPGAPGPLPDDLEAQLDTPDLRRQTVRQLAILATVDGVVRPDKVAVVEAAARRLRVDEFGLLVLGRIARGQYRRNGFGLMKRIVAHYWSPTGRARLRDWLAILWTVAPWFPGLRGYLGQDDLRARYLALAELPDDTLGHQVHRYYARNGFPVPGEPRSIPEGWARHEVYHVISSYGITLQGELLLAGFIAGNTEELALDLVLPALVQLHAGKTFVPGPTASGLLRPDAFFRAMARGAAMRVDLLAGWRLWDVADMKLRDLRERYGLPPLTPAETEALTQEKALLA
ncbi:MAG: hypothetical protein RLO51_26530 [Thalassobaculum sp.]|uniref:hypothetical protein n=1 Tax=Thalassobaculum sp. TaxID=2022740 RepID=UPI0032EFF99F